MSDLPVETTPGVAAPAHEAARGQIVYITEHGERVAAIVPAAVAAELERLSPGELAELLEDFADAAAASEARASIDAGEPLIPWDQVKPAARNSHDGQATSPEPGSSREHAGRARKCQTQR